MVDRRLDRVCERVGDGLAGHDAQEVGRIAEWLEHGLRTVLEGQVLVECLIPVFQRRAVGDVDVDSRKRVTQQAGESGVAARMAAVLDMSTVGGEPGR